ncbi:hypothetical protein EW026_g7093 [Hermanssonia centrifuga]|uniref:Uncharacterized protein n=1 Tax=Hermanssonia centrifuga TaxID=98765 RepID=A0A4S4K8X5_9APHY|nr:hypothetical protein EW026_g7093 [Hermanssonia centrifuga]
MAAMDDPDNHLAALASSSRYPTSSIRDEPYFRPPPDSPPYDPLNLLESDPPRLALDPIFTKYRKPVHRELVPGLREDGTLTVKHPLVDAFIDGLPRTSPREGRRPPRESWWTKGLKDFTVSDVLDLDVELDDVQDECIFVLAALKLLYHFHHRAHFTLWGREAGPRTARRVQKLLYMSPSPVASPVGWAGIRDQLWLLNGIQRSIFPNKCEGEGEGETASNGMTLRKRKSRSSAMAVADRPRKRTRTTAVHDLEKENAHLFGVDVEDVKETENETLSDLPFSAIANLDKAAKVEVINADFEPSIVLDALPAPSPEHSPVEKAVPLPDTTRRSSRQGHGRGATSTPDAHPASLPDATGPTVKPQRRSLVRARSSSSASEAGSSTAVSDNGSTASLETCVEAELDASGVVGNKRKRGAPPRKTWWMRSCRKRSRSGRARE